MSIYTVLISAEQILMQDWQFGSCLKLIQRLVLDDFRSSSSWLVSWDWGSKPKRRFISSLRVRLKGLVLKWAFVAYCDFKCKIRHRTENLQSLSLKRLIEDEGETVCVLVSIIRRHLSKNKTVQVAWRTLAKEQHCNGVKKWMFEGDSFACAWSCSICE